MSFNNPGGSSGQYAGYTPPSPSLEPPGRKRTSPWLYVSLGCGFLILLTFGGCVGAAMYFGNKMKHDMAQPVTAAQVDHDLGDTPRYPGAKIDSKTTQAARLVMTIMRTALHAKDGDGGAAGFSTPDSFLKVLTWYDTKLTKMGYSQGKSQSGNGYTYEKGPQSIMIQASRSGKSEEAGTQFMIMRFNNAHMTGN